MLSSSDLIRLPCTPDLTEAGIQHTCQWLAGTSRHLGEDPYNQLRRKISQVAVELAFRRLLVERQIPSQTMELEPFTEPNQHNLSLGGHHLHLNTTLLTRRQQIRSLRAEPDELLKVSALVPLDHFVQEGQTSKDIYLFAFLLALAATTRDDQQKIEARHQPHYYLSLLPGTWSRPAAWFSFSPLTIQNKTDQPVTMELVGLNSDRKCVVERLHLLPMTHTLPKEEFFSLACIHSLDRPASRLELHTPRIPRIHTIPITGWGNIWLYGLETWFAGWLTHEEFRRRSFVLPAGQHSYPFTQPREKNLCVPIRELRPLSELFEIMHSGKNKDILKNNPN